MSSAGTTPTLGAARARRAAAVLVAADAELAASAALAFGVGGAVDGLLLNASPPCLTLPLVNAKPGADEATSALMVVFEAALGMLSFLLVTSLSMGATSNPSGVFAMLGIGTCLERAGELLAPGKVDDGDVARLLRPGAAEVHDGARVDGDWYRRPSEGRSFHSSGRVPGAHAEPAVRVRGRRS